jgi:hypothetical protein
MDLHLKRVYVFCSKSSLLNFKNDSIIKGTALKKNEGSASTYISHENILTKSAYNDNLMMDVLIKIKDRDGVVHELQAPTDMAMNIMELLKASVGRNVRRNGYVLLANVMCLMMFHCQKWGR